MSEEKPCCPACDLTELQLAIILYGTSKLKLCKKCEERVNDEEIEHD
jgi:hypothetical protein